ncbi:hypothetical protein K9N68_35820 (plasmid) [Kovacikia minuta CCNUW1]|uniref:hypothetical protein n=1 Tax=Kovacikia minuta TaxID=2931930 RepID=UPI001CCCAF07|nr:hypothetical protein [Kovacikia minuta]UBF30548.1 hypothetical protein K9N68_35820 [Kovacikia minuta CCNUW1]
MPDLLKHRSRNRFPVLKRPETRQITAKKPNVWNLAIAPRLWFKAAKFGLNDFDRFKEFCKSVNNY